MQSRRSRGVELHAAPDRGSRCSHWPVSVGARRTGGGSATKFLSVINLKTVKARELTTLPPRPLFTDQAIE